MTARQQRRGDIEANEAGAAENEDSHFTIQYPLPRLIAAPYSSLAPKFRSGSTSDTRRPVGFAASPPVRARKRPEPASTERLPSATMTRPRDSTVTGQPRSLRPAKGV